MDQMNLVGIHNSGGYGSEFEYDSEVEKKREKRHDLANKPQATGCKLPKKREVTEEYNKDEGQRHRLHFLALDAYSRHKKLINCYLQFYSGTRSDFARDTSRDKRDIDVIRDHHQFLWDDDDEPLLSWEKRLARKYYDKLFKEYCIADLSRYKENKIALRWRIEKEVVEGKGQFSCGNKKCTETQGLRSWEVNFGYMEREEKKNALVKLRLCAECSYKLNYQKKKREILPKAKPISEEATTEEPQSKKAKVGTDPGDTTEGSKAAEATPGSSQQSSENEEDNLWAGPAKVVDEKTREEEFDDYFEDMFL